MGSQEDWLSCRGYRSDYPEERQNNYPSRVVDYRYGKLEFKEPPKSVNLGALLWQIYEDYFDFGLRMDFKLFPILLTDAVDPIDLVQALGTFLQLPLPFLNHDQCCRVHIFVLGEVLHGSPQIRKKTITVSELLWNVYPFNDYRPRRIK